VKDFKEYLVENVRVEVQNPKNLQDFEDPEVYFNGMYRYSSLKLKLKGYVDQLTRAVKMNNWKQAKSLTEGGNMTMNIPDILDAIDHVEREMGSGSWKSKKTKMKKRSH
jgi:hypothetical protein